MDDIAMPIDRFDLYGMVARFSDVLALQHVPNQAGASVLMVAAMLLRTVAPAGGEGLPAATGLTIKARTAAKLDEVDAIVVAAMVRAAVAFERGAEAAAPSPSGAQS